MKRKFCCTLNILEEVALYPNENRELRTLLSQHDQLVLDISADEIDAQENDPESILAALLKIEANGFTYHAQPGWQKVPEKLFATEAAGALFVMDRSAVECERLSRQYGVCVVNYQAAQAADYLTQLLVRKELVKASNYESEVNGSVRHGWYAALTVPELPITKVPLNAMVIIDTYLLVGGGRKFERAKENLISLLHALLPPVLAIDFHLLLVAANSDVPFEQKSFSVFSKEIEQRLKRDYKIQIGLITRPTGGKERRSITGNYFFCTSQHGFNCFENSTPDYNNDFIVNGAFEGAGKAGFDVPVRSMNTELETARNQLRSNRTLEAGSGMTKDASRRGLGFCDNRLLGLVAQASL